MAQHCVQFASKFRKPGASLILKVPVLNFLFLPILLQNKPNLN